MKKRSGLETSFQTSFETTCGGGLETSFCGNGIPESLVMTCPDVCLHPAMPERGETFPSTINSWEHHFATMAAGSGTNWSVDETRLLIQVWAEEFIQEQDGQAI